MLKFFGIFTYALFKALIYFIKWTRKVKIYNGNFLLILWNKSPIYSHNNKELAYKVLPNFFLVFITYYIEQISETNRFKRRYDNYTLNKGLLINSSLKFSKNILARYLSLNKLYLKYHILREYRCIKLNVFKKNYFKNSNLKLFYIKQNFFLKMFSAYYKSFSNIAKLQQSDFYFVFVSYFINDSKQNFVYKIPNLNFFKTLIDFNAIISINPLIKIYSILVCRYTINVLNFNKESSIVTCFALFMKQKLFNTYTIKLKDKSIILTNNIYNPIYYSLINNLYQPLNNISNFAIKYSNNTLAKFLGIVMLGQFILYFLRKVKIFNKGRYSRNRQFYRTGVYWCLYLSLILFTGLYY